MAIGIPRLFDEYLRDLHGVDLGMPKYRHRNSAERIKISTSDAAIAKID